MVGVGNDTKFYRLPAADVFSINVGAIVVYAAIWIDGDREADGFPVGGEGKIFIDDNFVVLECAGAGGPADEAVMLARWRARNGKDVAFVDGVFEVVGVSAAVWIDSDGMVDAVPLGGGSDVGMHDNSVVRVDGTGGKFPAVKGIVRAGRRAECIRVAFME